MLITGDVSYFTAYDYNTIGSKEMRKLLHITAVVSVVCVNLKFSQVVSAASRALKTPMRYCRLAT